MYLWYRLCDIQLDDDRSFRKLQTLGIFFNLIEILKFNVMEKVLILGSIMLFMMSCGSGTSGGATEEVTMEEESEIVDAISSDLEQAQEELQSQTSESLNEIDSLLQNLE